MISVGLAKKIDLLFGRGAKNEFVKVLFKHGSTTQQGVVEKYVAPGLKRAKYLCSTHCQIDVADCKYRVLWKFTQTDTGNSSVSAIQSHGSDDTSCNKDSDPEPEGSTEAIMHSLPFKVMGTCYSTKYQK